MKNKISVIEKNKNNKARAISICLFILILILHGTYLRNRSDSDIPAADWLTILRIIICTISLIYGVKLIVGNGSIKASGLLLIIYLLSAALSVINSPYPKIALGYVILISGATVLLIGLVASSQSVNEITQIERVWYIIISTLILKDSINSIFFPVYYYGAADRLGMGVTHANEISLYAGIVFWLSFYKSSKIITFFKWIFRIFLTYIIYRAISRISILAFLVGGMFYGIFKYKKSLKLITAFSLLICFFIGCIVLCYSFEIEWSISIIEYLQRGQNTEDLMSFTGRAEIWNSVVRSAISSPIIGNGYGMSRFAMGDLPSQGGRASHSHNEYFESFINTGSIGLILLMTIFIYNLKWIFKNRELQHRNGSFFYHAVSVIPMFMVTSFFETRISGRLSPFQMIFFLYLISIDYYKKGSVR